MDDTPIPKRFWVFIASWLFILLVAYGWQIMRMGGFQAHLQEIFIDLACVFPLLLTLWMAFFSQFVLPVRTFRDRQKIFDRLVTYLFGKHGPALFIENGDIKEHAGERLKKGPGVVWLDSASAAVTRTATEIKQTIGPGVYFLDKGEYIAGTIDLHNQSQSLGSKESEDPFAEKKEGQTEDEFREIQDRRKMVSALTRDGIEVIPNISITFRVNTSFPNENEPGSRFGYRKGVTSKAKQNEDKDKGAIRKAIIGQGVNLYPKPDLLPRRLAWNELPASLAVDIWREYAAKFTLDELFSPTQEVPPSFESLLQPVEEEIDPLTRPLQVSAAGNTLQDMLAKMLREINLFMAYIIKRLEHNKENKSSQKQKTTDVPEPEPQKPPADNINNKKEPQQKTALQVINEMVKARLTQSEVDTLNETGKRSKGGVTSQEYLLLEARGLKVQSVSIGNLRLSSEVDEQLKKQWSTTWLANAKSESEQIERKRSIIETSARERALISYAKAISQEVNELAGKSSPEIKGTLKTLLLRSRALIRSGEYSEQLRRRMSVELQDIEDMIKWMEANGK